MKIGQKREMMMDTSIKAVPTPSGNSDIKEDMVFDKTKVEKNQKDPVSLEIKPMETIQEEPNADVEPPKKATRGRPKMSPERAAQVKKERTERLVAARAKSLEIRRVKMNQKKVAAGKLAEQKLNSSPRAQALTSPPPQESYHEPVQEVDTPLGFSGTSKQNVGLPPGFSGNPIDYNTLSKTLWGHMQNQQTEIDEQALHAYGEKIRLEEAQKAKALYTKEYENLERQKKRINQMGKSVSILSGVQNTYKPTHRVFGKRVRGTKTYDPTNPYASCF
jgi:hypothetical protein